MTPFYRIGVSVTEGGEWLEPDDACRRLGIGVGKLLRLVDAGDLVAEGVDGRIVISRESVELLAALGQALRPSQRQHDLPPPPTPPEGVPEVDLGVMAQAQLLGRFLDAAQRGVPGPCPVCGEVLRPL